jgi:hypothetical protein
MQDLIDEKLFRLLGARHYITGADRNSPCVLCGQKLADAHPGDFIQHMENVHQATPDVVNKKYLVRGVPIKIEGVHVSFGKMCFLCGSNFKTNEELKQHLIQGHKAGGGGETGTATPPQSGMLDQTNTEGTNAIQELGTSQSNVRQQPDVGSQMGGQVRPPQGAPPEVQAPFG